MGRKIIDLTGMKFGKLIVIERDLNPKSKVKGKIYWICQCECGNIITVEGGHLKSGNTTSCGCARAENLINKKFGKLKVLNRDTKKNNGVYWICKCECGNIVSVLAKNLKNGRSSSCGCFKKSKNVVLIEEILNKFNIKYKKEFTFDNLRGINNGLLRFDFAILDNFDNLQYLIEYDGEQHFDKNSIFYHETIAKHDIMKNEYCKNNKIILYRINYTDDVEKRILQIINKNK